MKNKFSQWLTVVVFCAFLGVMCLMIFLLPKKDFSENEKRYLAEPPALSWSNISSGQFGEDAESYMADHLAGRDFFVGLNAYFEKLTGRQVSKDIYTAGDRLVEAPVKWNDNQVRKNQLAIEEFAKTIDTPVYLMIVPSAGWAIEDQIDGIYDPYEDERFIFDIYNGFGQGVEPVDVLSALALQDLPALYYKTDHHWTSLGAYTAYAAYMETLGREYPAKEQFRVETVSDFKGSTYSRSALWQIPGEDLEMWLGTENLLVTNNDTTEAHQGVFYRERLEEADKYTVFLDGNHSLVRIQNPNAEGKGKILVIRDSYSNCLGAFLAESYETVVLVDLRYYKDAVSELYKAESFDDVLVCYSLSNYMTDNNLVWLR